MGKPHTLCSRAAAGRIAGYSLLAMLIGLAGVVCWHSAVPCTIDGCVLPLVSRKLLHRARWLGSDEKLITFVELVTATVAPGQTATVVVGVAAAAEIDEKSFCFRWKSVGAGRNKDTCYLPGQLKSTNTTDAVWHVDVGISNAWSNDTWELTSVIVASVNGQSASAYTGSAAMLTPQQMKVDSTLAGPLINKVELLNTSAKAGQSVTIVVHITDATPIDKSSFCFRWTCSSIGRQKDTCYLPAELAGTSSTDAEWRININISDAWTNDTWELSTVWVKDLDGHMSSVRAGSSAMLEKQQVLVDSTLSGPLIYSVELLNTALTPGQTVTIAVRITNDVEVDDKSFSFRWNSSKSHHNKATWYLPGKAELLNTGLNRHARWHVLLGLNDAWANDTWELTQVWVNDLHGYTSTVQAGGKAMPMKLLLEVAQLASAAPVSVVSTTTVGAIKTTTKETITNQVSTPDPWETYASSSPLANQLHSFVYAVAIGMNAGMLHAIA